MKIVYALLIGIVLFSFAGIIQAQEDPYAGTYSCSGQPQEGCGSGDLCESVEIAPPDGVTVTHISGNSYQICPHFSDDALGIRGNDDECDTVEINDGVAHWSGTITGEGITFTGEVTAKFDGSTINAEESGQVSGLCTCSVSLSAICTK